MNASCATNNLMKRVPVMMMFIITSLGDIS